ncbi:MAG: DNA polymerase Y family protein [Mesorhizobium sp.]
MIEPALMKRRYLALWFPLLPADRWRRTESAGSVEAPTAFVEKRGGAVYIVALDPSALRLGLTPDLTLADARARVPGLVAIEHDLHADRLWLERIADYCDLWSPMVELDPPDGVTLDITGCTHLFGSETTMALEVERRFHAARMSLRYAYAGTPEAAQALARFHTVPVTDEHQAIRNVSIAALRLEKEAETALRRAGLKTLGDLASRPSAPLAARFGPKMMMMLDRLLGHADSRISPRRMLPALLFERRFAEPIARTEDVLAALDDLVREAADVLEKRCVGGRRFVGRLYRSDGNVREITVETGLPIRDPTVTARLFRERIDALADLLDPGFGYDLVRLAIPMVEPIKPSQLGLEGGQLNTEVTATLVDRLSTRLGRERIRRLVRRDTHIPERQTLALPAIDMVDPASWPSSAVNEPPLRPLHMFDPPEVVEVLAEVPDGPPQRFRWRRSVHEVKRFEGPERIAGEWWRVPVDRLPDPEPSIVRQSNDEEENRVASRPRRPLLTRDYFRVEDAYGRRFWLFRRGLYERETDSPTWYIHGLFA